MVTAAGASMLREELVGRTRTAGRSLPLALTWRVLFVEGSSVAEVDYGHYGLEVDGLEGLDGPILGRCALLTASASTV